MRALRAWIVRIAGVIRPSRRERELAAEIESHFQLHIDDNIRAGMTPDQARRAAIAKFGPIEAIKDDYRDRAGIPALEVLAQDARYGMRRLFRQPGFAVLIIVTLALGVGANAAMFGLVDRLMFRMPEHVHDPQRLLDVPGADNYVRYQELRGKLRSVELAAYVRPQTLSFGAGSSALPLRTQCVSAPFLPLLGVSPQAGRFFTPDEESIGSERVIVLSHGLWQRQFGGDPGVTGRSVAVGGRSYSVIGITPAGFAALDPQPVDAWILLTAAPEACSPGGSNRLRDANGSWLSTIARLQPAVTLAEATGEIAVAEAHRKPMILKSGRVIETAAKVRLRYPPKRQLTDDARLALWLAGGAGVLLILACTNIAGLLSMRAVDRRREIALRLQLGATRRRLAAQLLVEHLLIAVLGAVVAVAVAAWLGDMFGRFFLFDGGPGVLDARLLGMLTALALVAGLLSGTFPALQATRDVARDTLRTGRTATPASARVRTTLLVTQIGLALVLVVGAGLFVRSVQKFRDDFAYDLDRVVTAAVDFRRSTTTRPADIHAAFERMLERVVQLPQVEAAALSSAPILGSGGSVRVFWIRRDTTDEGAGHMLTEITPDYFRTLGLRITAGRAFEPADATSERRVIVINSILAAKLFPGEDAIGKCIILGSAACTEIIGVSESFRGTLLHDQGDSQVFVPLRASSNSETTPQVLLVRTRSSASHELAPVAAALQGTSNDLPYVSVQPLTALADRQARSWLLGATAFSLFGALAVALAAIGIFGALAFSVRQRTLEIGVRMALGAERGDIAGLILRYGAFVLIVGGALGAVGAFAASRFVRSLLFNVVPGDPPAFALALGVLALAVLAGCLIPLWRATRIDPAVALRYE